MNYKQVAALSCAFVFAAPCYGHRLDEYLQATLVSIEKTHLDLSIRLVPGVAVSPVVLGSIDADGSGSLSEAEQKAYAARVLGDLSLRVDGTRLAPRLISAEFPAPEQIKEGLGQIQIAFSADLPEGGAHREIVVENHHLPAISVYLMNCLVPRDRSLRIVSQNRNRNQSFYRIGYQLAGDGSTQQSRAVGFASIFRLGIRHIAEGTDHLLFLLALLLPAPLTVFASRWSAPASLRRSVLQILKVVTAFTVGHSITLAAAGMGLVHVPSRPIEVLIAASILVSAVHAMRPLFAGKEPRIAAFFGLIHGLAFASTIQGLGLDHWERVLSIFAFNLGIEAMQLVVVTATMPSLFLLSRARAYSVLRIGGALCVAVAAVAWVAERLLAVHTPVDAMVGGIAHRSVWIAASLFLVSVVSWSFNNFPSEGTRRIRI